MKIHNPFRTALVATLGVGLGIILISSVQTLSTILLYIGTALFLSLGLDPLVSFLERRRLPRWAAVLVTIVAVLGVFAGIFLIVLPVVIDQITQLIAQITAIVERDNALDDLREWLGTTFPNLDVDKVYAYVMDWLETNLADIGQGVISASGAVLGGLFGTFIVLILTIYLTASTPSLKRAVYQLAPASKRERFIDLADQITASVGYYVMGQVPQGVITGVLSMIFLSIIRGPFPS